MKKFLSLLALVITAVLLFGVCIAHAESDVGIIDVVDAGITDVVDAGIGTAAYYDASPQSSDKGIGEAVTVKKTKNKKIDFEINDETIMIAYILNGEDFDIDELEHEGEAGYGKLRITLRDAANQSVKNVRFSIFTDNEYGKNSNIGSITTNERGIAVTMLPAGDYYISQPALPSGYIWPQEAESQCWRRFTISEDRVTRINETCISTAKGRVRVTATDQNGDPVEGAIFTITTEYSSVYYAEDTTPVNRKEGDLEYISSDGNGGLIDDKPTNIISKTIKSNSKGIATADLPAGVYRIKVSGVPAGCSVSSIYTTSGGSSSSYSELPSSHMPKTYEEYAEESKSSGGAGKSYFSSDGAVSSFFEDSSWLSGGHQGISSAVSASFGVDSNTFVVSERKASYVDVEFIRSDEPLGSLCIILRDQNGNGVSHGVYSIYNYSMSYTVVDGSLKATDRSPGFYALSVATDDNGYSITALPEGDYVIYEESADLPNGYKPGTLVNAFGDNYSISIARSTPFSISVGKTTTLNLNCVHEEKGSLSVHLVDQNGDNVPSATYYVERYASSQYGHLGTEVVCSINIKNGYGSADKLEPGTYFINETSAKLPGGYEPGSYANGFISVSRSGIPCSVKDGETTSVTVTCHKVDSSPIDPDSDPDEQEGNGRVAITCFDQDGNRVAGVKYTVLKWESSVYGLLSEHHVTTISTNDNGEGISGLIPAGSYQIHVGNAVYPDGYVGGEMDANGFVTVEGETRFAVNSNEITHICLRCVNFSKKGNVKIKLLDENGNGVSGATFYISQWESSKYGLLRRNLVTTAITNHDGIAYATLPEGTYDLTEPKIPGKYRYGKLDSNGLISVHDMQFTVNTGKTAEVTTYCVYDLGVKTLDDYTGYDIYIKSSETKVIDDLDIIQSTGSHRYDGEIMDYAGEQVYTTVAANVYGRFDVLDYSPDKQLEDAGFRWMDFNGISAYWKKMVNGSYVYANVICPKYFFLRDENGKASDQLYGISSFGHKLPQD